MAMTGGVAKLVHTGIPNNGTATNYPLKLYVYYKSTQNKETNKSTMSVGMYFVVPANYDVGPWTDYAGSYVGTESLTFTGTIPNMTGTRWLAENKTYTVDHDSEGKAKATIKWKWGVRSTWGGCYEESGSFTVDLPTIPRASSIGATDANIESNSAITVTKKASSYVHSIKYEFGSLSGYITSSGGISTTEVKFSNASVSFAIPTAFYAQIPNATSGTCKLTCTTYSSTSSTTVIGSAQTTTFKVTTSQSLCKPTVSGSVIDAEAKTVALTGNENKLVKFFSRAVCTISATPKNGATIKTKKIAGQTVSGTSLTLSNVETNSFSFSATDSRGYSGSDTEKLTMIDYIKLTSNVQLVRVDSTSGDARLSIKGNYFNNTFGAVANALTVKYRVAKANNSYGDWITVSPTISGNSYSITIPLNGLDYQSAYVAQAYCADKLMALTTDVEVSKGTPIADWNDRDFRFNVPVRVTSNMFGSTLPTEARKGQLFFLKNSDGTYSIRIYDGTSW